MNVLDFFSSLGFLYLFYKMGQRQLREEKISVLEPNSDTKKVQQLLNGENDRDSAINNKIEDMIKGSTSSRLEGPLYSHLEQEQTNPGDSMIVMDSRQRSFDSFKRLVSH